MCRDSNATAGLSQDNEATNSGLQSHSGLENKRIEYSGGVFHVLLSRKEKIEMLLYEVEPFYKSSDLPLGV